ncbi:MAG TPA: hypothetical protein VIU15_47460 [Streptomyces sp.]
MYPGPTPLPDTGFGGLMIAAVATAVVFAGLLALRLSSLRRAARGRNS